MKVEKRSGKIVEFENSKIVKAVKKAFGAVEINIQDEKINELLAFINTKNDGEIKKVEDIQDSIVKWLHINGYHSVGIAFTKYRERRAIARDTSFNSVNLVNEYLCQLDDMAVHENSSTMYSLQGLNNHLFSSVSEKYWLSLYSDEIKKAYNSGRLHIHDLQSISAYTYFGKECVIVKNNNKIELLSLESLYDKIEAVDTIYINKDDATIKTVNNLMVLDKDGWTNVSKLTKKRKDNKMLFIKNKNGRSVIVTDNHPMITQIGELKSKNITKEHKTYVPNIKNIFDKTGDNLFSKDYVYVSEFFKENKIYKLGKDNIYIDGMVLEDNLKTSKNNIKHIHSANSGMLNKIKLDSDLGYFIGFYLAEGSQSYNNKKTAFRTSLTNKDLNILKKLQKILSKIGVFSTINVRKTFVETGVYTFDIFNRIFITTINELFNVMGTSHTKKLPINILEYNIDFVKGVLSGIIDGDGSNKTGLINIRIASRELLNQISFLADFLNINIIDSKPFGAGSKRTYKGREIIQRKCLYGMTFRKKTKFNLPDCKKYVSLIKQKTQQDEYDYEIKDTWYETVQNIEIPIIDEYIYDITTDTNTLIVNGMYNHNCSGWDLKSLLLEGFGGVAGKPSSKPPKHLSSALNQANNFIFTVQGEFAGAIAFSNFNTLLAPFVREDNLSYNQVKQEIQQFIYNLNISTRVGFQCLSEDTEILSENGWVGYNDLKVGDKILTFNMSSKQFEYKFEYKETQNVFKEQYEGKMVHISDGLFGYIDHLVTPNHRVVVYDEKKDEYVFENAENIKQYENDINIPIPIPAISDPTYDDMKGVGFVNIQKDDIKFVDYSGIVWCPTTENGTVIARRNGKCFITGNSPFSNLTLDLDSSKVKFADEPCIIGGEMKEYSYGECNKEATWINQAVVEVLSEGDADGAMLSYPIVTFNVTKDFPWQNKLGKTVLDATSKYGSFYWANYINSDCSESDITSMCCRLKIDRREIQKHLGEYTGGLSETEYDKTHQKGHGFFGASPNTGCYDEQTEVLTKDGWKFWKDVTYKDIFITMNMKNKNIEYQEPTQLFDYEYVGDMVEIKNKNFDLLVTPNHNMLINVNKGTYKLISAEDMVGRYQTLIPKQADWVGEDIDFFELDEITFKKSFYGNKYEETKESIKIKTTDWAEFMGWFLSEGSFDNENIAQSHGYRVFITQVKEQNKKIIESLLNKMPFNWSQDGANYIICNKQLWMYVKQFGKAHDKFIPEFIKSLSKKYLKIFYDAIMLGDGHTKKDGQQFYYTCSSKLRDDMQEIILKLGLSSNVYERTRTDVKKIKGRIINSDKQYEINVLRSENYKIRKHSVNKKKYSGKVYCAEVPNHTLYVRRNGKTTWCGNSIGVTTLNIPAIMYDAKEKGGDWDEFLTLVKYYMDLAIEVLMKKRKVVEEYMEKGLYPYARHYLREVKKRTGHYFTQHFSTICPNGIHEALYIYGFKDGIMCDDGLNKAIELLKFMNEYTVELQKEFKVLINLEQAPAESAGVKLCQKSGVDPFGNGYYTNSSWQPAESKIDLIDLIDMQGKLNVYYTGGSSMHTYTDSDLVPIANDLQKIIMYAFTETKIPYMTISPVFSVCHKCGRMAGKHHICPKCGSKKIEIYERIVGYYRPHTNWNKGRLKESEKRNYLKLDKKS